MNPKLKTLYQEVILTHNKNPIHFYEMENADHLLEAYNPVCGDRFKVFLKVTNHKIAEASFKGYGCAISKASASVMVENLVGLSINEVVQLINEFEMVIEKGLDTETTARTSFQAFAAAKSFPGRKKCATLGWDELKLWMNKQD